MPAIPSTQLPLTYEGTRYSGVYSVSGNLIIARIPGMGSKSKELAVDADVSASARSLLQEILDEAVAQGRLS